MRILFIGKAPPLQGGAAVCVSQTAQALVRMGHAVDLLTDCDEIDASMRTHGGRLAPGHPYRRIAPEPIGAFEHFPRSTLRTQRLLGRARALVREQRYDALVGWYLLPYGCVAAEAACASGIPLVLVHGGSDLNTLSLHPDLREAISSCLARASLVLTPSSRETVRRLRSLGADPASIRKVERAFPLPAFHQAAEGPALEDVVAEVRADLPASMDGDPELRDLFLELGACKRLAGPTIVQYGKQSAGKRSIAVLEALARLAAEGRSFGYIGLHYGRRDAVLASLRLLRDSGLARQAIALPAVDPALVPCVLRSADIGVCLESAAFGVPNHLSVMPREMWNAGLALVMSADLARAPFLRWVARPGLNVAICAPRCEYEVFKGLLDAPRDVRALQAASRTTSRVVEREIGDANPVAEQIERFLRAGA